MLFSVLLIIHAFICVALIIVVLMQSAKGEGLAGAFGGGAITGAVFGGRGAASFLSKATTAMAIVFMVSCLALSLLSAGRSTSSAPTDSAVTRAGQQSLDEQAQQEGVIPMEGEGASPEDIFPEGQQQQGQQATPDDIFNQTQPAEPPAEGSGQ